VNSVNQNMPIQTSSTVELTHQFMSEVLQLKDARFVDGTRVLSLVDRFGIDGLEARIYFLRELHGIIRKLPLKVFGNDNDRTRLLDAVQDALDRAIDEEDA
jgi:type III secretion protein W